IPETEPRRISVPLFGVKTFVDVFNARQLLAACSLAKYIRLAASQFNIDAELQKAVTTLMTIALNKVNDFNCSFSRWRASNEDIGNLFGRQAIGMVWDFAETNISAEVYVSWKRSVSYIEQVLAHLNFPITSAGSAVRGSALSVPLPDDSCDIFFTDPPYYDSVP